MDDGIRGYESAFRRAGLPNLIEDYTAGEDVFTRALPFLTLVFLLEILNALDLRYAWWANVLFVLGGVAIALGALGALNVARGRRFASMPRRVGRPELAVFVLVPPLLPLVFGGQWRSALVTLVGQLLLLGLVYLVVGFGLPAILRWAGARFLTQLRASLSLLVRALPLLLFFALITFFANEYWQMFANTPRPKFLAAVALFALLAALFLLVRNPASVRELERSSDLGRPLSRPQRVNVGVVIFVSQVLQILFVVAAIWLFFMVFGALLVTESILQGWIGHPGHEIFALPLGSAKIRVTQELVRVATGTAAFSGLYYAVAMLVDSNYRDEFVTQITDDMRETFSKRAEYLRLLAVSGGSRASASPSSVEA